MSERWDAIVIGGGHNGLVAAAYLARAGKKTLVLERRPLVGGAAVTEEVFPGFKFSVFSYVVSLLRPEIIRDLDLPAHGLQILPLESTITPLDNGDYLGHMGRSRRVAREALRRHSPRDADAMPIFGRLMHHMAMAVKPILGMVPPDPASLSPGGPDGPAQAGRTLPLARRRALPRAPQADDDEQRRLPRRVVRVRRAQGHQVGERHHRHLPRAALARLGLRAPPPLHGRDRRRVPRVGIPEGRHRRDQRRDRERRARARRGDPHRRRGRARGDAERPRDRRGARERRGDRRAIS